MPDPGCLPEEFTGPALVDLQVNGFAGFDFNGDPSRWTVADWRRVADRLEERGIGAAFPTFITDDRAAMLARIRAYRRLTVEESALSERFPRIHVEGPFVSPEDGPRGAHPRAHCLAPIEWPEFLEEVVEASGERLGLLTLAPELPGALDLIARTTEHGVCVAIGHTAADAGTLDHAVVAGCRLSTHLGNGSHDRLPRLDNYLQRQLGDDRLCASFIADGHHVPYPTLKSFIRAKEVARAVLVSDAMAAAAAPAGRYRLGALEVEVIPGGSVTLPGTPYLAGSSLTLDRAVVNVVRHCGIDFAAAWQMASTRPAMLLGMPPLPTVHVRVSEEGMRVMG